MRQRYLYDNGLPFQRQLAENLDALKDRINKDKASLMIIDGFMGEGKTTLSVHCADYFQGSKINLKNQIAYGGDEFIQKLIDCYKKKIPVLVYDEAGDFSKRGALSEFNRKLNRVFEIMRGFKVFVILCLPNFHYVDSKLLDDGVGRLLLHTYGRTRKYGYYKGYDLTKMYKIKEQMFNLKKRGSMPALSYKFNPPNFHGPFLDLDARRSKQLNEISTASKVDLMKEITQKDNDNVDNLYSIKDLSTELKRNYVYIGQKLKKLDIKPIHIKRNVNYYDKNAFEILKKSMKRGR